MNDEHSAVYLTCSNCGCCTFVEIDGNIYCIECRQWQGRKCIAYKNRLTTDQLEAPCQMKPDKAKSKPIYIDDMPELKEPSPYDGDYFEDDDLPWE